MSILEHHRGSPGKPAKRWRGLALILLVLAVALVAVFFGSRGGPKGRMPKIGIWDDLMVVKADGSLWALGRNFGYSTIGDGKAEDRPRFVRIGKANDWVDVLCGTEFSLALKSDGSLWAWGLMGGLSDGTNLWRNQPVRVGQDHHDWVRIAVAAEASGLSWGWRSDGTLWALGQNSSVPVQLGRERDRDWKAIAGSGRHTLAVKTDGTLWAWGWSAGGTPDGRVPVQIGTTNDWTEISAGLNHSVAIKVDGSLWTWGENILGELGDGTTERRLTPKRIGESADWRMVASGFYHNVALKFDGSLWAWGCNSSGQIGDGTTTNRLVPVRIGNANDWVWVSAGLHSSVALKADGSLWIWGREVRVEGKRKVWLRKVITKLKMPIKLSPPRTMNLVPVKIADLGAFSAPADQR